MKWSIPMAHDRMMIAADVVANAMGGEHGDLLREAAALVVTELMEVEVATLTGAGRVARVDQCGVLERGTNVLTIASSTCSSVTVRGRPRRGSSTRPSRRSLANRERHFVIVGRLSKTLRDLAVRKPLSCLRARSVIAAPAPRTRAPTCPRLHCSRSSALSTICTATGSGIQPSATNELMHQGTTLEPGDSPPSLARRGT
jgi:hypothetical protein